MKRVVRGSVTALLFVFVAAGVRVPLFADSLGPAINAALAQARAATARYHDVDVAIAEGFVDMGVTPDEGNAHEFVNFGLVDCTLDIAQPEALRYTSSGNGLRLVAVEYAFPMACGSEPPDDFLPGVGEWEPEPGVPVWTLAAPIW